MKSLKRIILLALVVAAPAMASIGCTHKTTVIEDRRPVVVERRPVVVERERVIEHH